jgi:hypothetical protein
VDVNHWTGITQNEDNAFGPENDLVLSLLVILLLVGVLAWFQGNRLVEKKDEIIQRTQRTLVFGERASTFSRGSAQIRPDDEQSLKLKVADFKSKIRAGQFQYFEISGVASPEVGKVATNFDINLTKGYERAQAVAKILRSGGFPYECMKLSTYGRATSDYLNTIITARSGTGAGDVLHTFDSDRAGALSNEGRFAGERRTEIWGIPPARKDDGSPIPSVCMLLLSSSSR